jgi:hypothetical protein
LEHDSKMAATAPVGRSECTALPGRPPGCWARTPFWRVDSRRSKGDLGRLAGVLLTTTEAGEGRQSCQGWFTGDGWSVFIPLCTLTMVAIGVLVAGHGYVLRGRVEEAVAGGVVLVLAVAYWSWAHTRKNRALAVLAGIAAIVQLVAVLYYYYTGMAADANQYSRAAVALLDPDGVLPARMRRERNEWSNWMVVRQTALVYRLVGPNMLVAFLAFSTVAVAAKMLFASTVLRLRPLLGRGADFAALAVVVFPSLALWLAAISKEASAVLGVSLVIAGVARPVGERPRLVLIALGLAAASMTRPHIAALLAGSVVVFAAVNAALVSQSFGRRLAIIVGAAVFGVGAVFGAASFFDVEPTRAGFDSVRDGVADRNEAGEQGDSDIEARPIRHPLDVPQATANVLVRPFLHEASGSTQLMQATETMLVLLLVLVLLLPNRWRKANRVTGTAKRFLRSLRLFAYAYTAVFVYSFSGMYNLGLMSRQRSQYTLFLLLLLATALTTTRGERQKTPRASVLVNTSPGWEPLPASSSTPPTGPLAPVARKGAPSD